MPKPVHTSSSGPAVPRPSRLRVGTVALAVLARTTAAEALPPADPLAVAGTHPIATLHAEGTQLYECRADAAGALAWRFREPQAVLTRDGKTVGRHFAGPTWVLADGGAVVGKVEAQAPGATAGDIALLRLAVVDRRGRGELTPATLVQRLNTHGGAFAGPCGQAGETHAEPYSADYVFSAPS